MSGVCVIDAGARKVKNENRLLWTAYYIHKSNFGKGKLTPPNKLSFHFY